MAEKTRPVNGITTHKSKRTILNNLRELRELIDTTPDKLESRIAYAMETAVRWMILETVDWDGLAEEAKKEAAIYREQYGK